jgi:60S ribosomal subunit assembly/export protein LOC1
MEEIREARRNEAEAKKDTKKSKLEETKDSLRRPRKKKPVTEAVKEAMDEDEKKPRSTKKIKKRVSFG